jgi:hypothetical protein
MVGEAGRSESQVVIVDMATCRGWQRHGTRVRPEGARHAGRAIGVTTSYTACLMSPDTEYRTEVHAGLALYRTLLHPARTFVTTTPTSLVRQGATPSLGAACVDLEVVR